MLLEMLPQLFVVRLGFRLERLKLDKKPSGPDLLPLELVGLPNLRLGDLDPVLDERLHLPADKISALILLETGRVHLGLSEPA